ncbi:hypothetical protein JMJ77_0007056 [Colletotrichum scovillei]|uniref:Uncharacterized protein n=1 Tax=Colletotrichum scovillei TaxID=1209932 RepID=A0A9P7UF96_9PEZI|nr:hypothetical protein JMJ77_0007056 [Colletotrichum scovillei]KAG7074057.1 hypothetical protein JMJ76_0010545 [Colletotrichum scovillei]KAG7080990.1 hypothetical protein JMJ78_0003122 [Colletotrichum scovillei]
MHEAFEETSEQREVRREALQVEAVGPVLLPGSWTIRWKVTRIIGTIQLHAMRLKADVDFIEACL